MSEKKHIKSWEYKDGKWHRPGPDVNKFDEDKSEPKKKVTRKKKVIYV
jgi:hypothetical protein